MDSYGLLDQNDEDNLHALRLLNVEEKPFRRLAKRLLASDSFANTPRVLPPTPPPDASGADEAAAAREAEIAKLDEQCRQWRDDTLLDFAAYESNIIRVQFLLNSNERERERYAAEKLSILETAQAVRENNAQLHEQLGEAQRMLGLRKTYDALAEKITSNRFLKPRDDQHAQLEKLNIEIGELERESAEYSRTWADRREQFGRIVEEGMQMLRLIRDEKEEAERKEGMEDMDDGDEPETSKNGTPRPSAGMATPAHASHEGEHTAGFLSSVSQAQALEVTPVPAQNSRGGSLAPEQPPSNAEDAQMADGEDTGAEEGETTEQDEPRLEKMDTSQS